MWVTQAVYMMLWLNKPKPIHSVITVITTTAPWQAEASPMVHMSDMCEVFHVSDVMEERGVLTVAVGWILRPADVASVVDCQEPLRAAEQLTDTHISSLHVVVVPGVALVFGAVHDGGELLWRAVTVDHTHAAEQEDCMEVQSWDEMLKVPCQHPFAHYNTMQWGSVNNMLKCETVLQPSDHTKPDWWPCCDLQDPVSAAGSVAEACESFGQQWWEMMSCFSPHCSSGDHSLTRVIIQAAKLYTRRRC